MQHTESKIQIACVIWFHVQYRNEPDLCRHFFSVPNGGKRSKKLVKTKSGYKYISTEGKILKDEGAKAGVSDLLLLIPNSRHTFLSIEMKSPTGSQSKEQKEFGFSVSKLGFGKYVICKSFDEFRNEIQNYLASTQWGKKVS